jgi:hypothetical protein
LIALNIEFIALVTSFAVPLATNIDGLVIMTLKPLLEAIDDNSESTEDGGENIESNCDGDRNVWYNGEEEL